MSIKLAEAAEFFKGLPHQINAFNWLQDQVSSSVLESFAAKYRNLDKEKSSDDYSNTWEGVVAAAKIAGAKFPEVVAAQWALESNWGKDMSGTNNYFGLKGEGNSVNTQEFINGKWVTIKDNFINFADLLACVTYLVDHWYKDYKDYKGVNRANTKEECARLLVAENYATDPSYSEKVIQIINTKKTPLAQQQAILPVIYMSQRDNYRDASRTCFSSSCAMMLKYLKPNSIQDDNNYLMAVFQYGDSTDSNAQLKALKKFGVDATFTTKGNRALVHKQIDNKKPVPVGFLHHGTVDAPTGSGHWLCIIGYDDTGYWVNDPWGECDLLSGTYPKTYGAKLHYSYKNFEPRWLVEGPNSGWCIVA